MTTRRIQLSTIEEATDISSPTTKVLGAFCLTRLHDSFFFHWNPLDGTATQHVTAVFQASKISREDCWDPGRPFVFDCKDAQIFQIEENPLRMSLSRHSKPGIRKFEVPDDEFLSLAQLIEQLLINGISVPGTKHEFCVEIYRLCYRGVYAYTPPHIQLAVREFTNLDDFWKDVHHFFESLIIHLDASDTLPRDQDFPLSTAARACHGRVLRKFDEFVAQLPTFERITADCYDNLFDTEGRIKNPSEFRLRLYHGGVDPSIRAQILPFAVGLYPLNSTSAERIALDNELKAEFATLLSQTNNMLPTQRQSNRRLNDGYRVIAHDVTRTDRHLNAFKSPETAGGKMLTKLLQTFAVFNPPLGYLQGMNDLFVPIILAMIQNWTDEGEPVDESGEPIDVAPLMPLIFWSFEAMLRNTGHLHMLANVTEDCPKQAIRVHQLISAVSPLAAIWIRRRGLKDLLWCYSDFVLLFKRTYADDVWPVWLKFNCAPVPTHWLSYFVAAILIGCFDRLTELPDVQITAMMDSFPRLLSELSTDRIGKIALWLHATAPLPEEIQTSNEDVDTSLDFFEPQWLQKESI
jgi:hypothetical protein